MALEIEKRDEVEMEEKHRELAEKVAAARLDEIKQKFTDDMKALKELVPTAAKKAVEAAKDIKYLREGQLTLCC